MLEIESEIVIEPWFPIVEWKGKRSNRRCSAIRGRKRHEASDPVAVAVFAIDQIGPAMVRACASGVEVRVATVDDAMAAAIRAALAETARHRPTDLLVKSGS